MLNLNSNIDENTNNTNKDRIDVRVIKTVKNLQKKTPDEINLLNNTNNTIQEKTIEKDKAYINYTNHNNRNIIIPINTPYDDTSNLSSINSLYSIPKEASKISMQKIKSLYSLNNLKNTKKAISTKNIYNLELSNKLNEEILEEEKNTIDTNNTNHPNNNPHNNNTTNIKKPNAMKSSTNTIRISIESIPSNSINTNTINTQQQPLQPMLNNTEKNDYQRKLTNQISMDKYKVQFFTIIKEDDDILKSLEILKLNDISRFIENYFFGDLVFKFKLEKFLIQQNGNTKQKKEKFFREEIKKVVEIKLLDVQLDKKFKALNVSIEKHIKNINGFSFFDK